MSTTELRATGDQTKGCSVCGHRDRAMIESLLAAGVFYSDLADEFGLQERSLRRHDAVHSTLQPSVDPLSILRSLRWLHEQSTLLTRDLLRRGAGQRRAKEIYNLRLQALHVTLAITSAYAKLTNTKKHIDAAVTLPRWRQVMSKLGDALRTIPEAQAALVKLQKEEGPGRREDKDSNTTTESRFGQ